jgi:hypothetical protein
MIKLELPENLKFDEYKKIINPKKKIAYLFGLFSNQERYQENEENLGGVLDMIGGLEYHIEKIRCFEKDAGKFASEYDAMEKSKKLNLSDLPQTNHHDASHEAVAYVGRLGQLKFFFNSEWFTNILSEKVIASTARTILALQPIRNKSTSHRQQDCPKRDDCESLGFNQYGLVHRLVGSIGEPEKVWIQYSFPTKQRESLLRKHNIPAVDGVEEFGDENNHVIFEPTKIHSTIINEAISLLELFFNLQSIP